VAQRQPPLDESTIADTVEAVFSARQFNPPRSIWWWTDYLPRLRIDPQFARPFLIALVVAIALLAIAWWAYRRWLERRYGPIVHGAADMRARPRDPWTAAQEFAAAGSFSLAAHALHFAMLEAIARREQVHLHPSKTIGDYLRELRVRSSGLLPAVREFARAYELIAYGARGCDRDDYTRLQALALPVVRPHG
jgi:hypothetical protein